MSASVLPGVVVRPGRDDDAEGFIALVASCWAEYPGCVFDLDGEVPELRALASYFAAAGGVVWAAEAEGRVVGMVGVRPAADGAWELAKMYVARSWRGTALAATLLATAEAHAAGQGARRLLLWSDTRFDRAHRFYEKHDLVRGGPIRALGDRSNTIEFGYAKPRDGIERLDAAGASSAIRRLGAILRDWVAEQAFATDPPPLARERAEAYWRDVARDVAAGTRILLVAWRAFRLVGTVHVDLDTPPTQPRRADVRKLLVVAAARRNGIATALIGRAQDAALAAGRDLLTLDTRAGDAAERLGRRLGWREGGRIPRCAINATGGYDDVVSYYRDLAAR